MYPEDTCCGLAMCEKAPGVSLPRAYRSGRQKNNTAFVHHKRFVLVMCRRQNKITKKAPNVRTEVPKCLTQPHQNRAHPTPSMLTCVCARQSVNQSNTQRYLVGLIYRRVQQRNRSNHQLPSHAVGREKHSLTLSPRQEEEEEEEALSRVTLPSICATTPADR